MPGDVGRVDLELHEEDEGVAGRYVTEFERETAVVAGLVDGRGLQRVDAHALAPAGVELEDRLLQVVPGGDVEARLHEVATADRGRGINGDRRGRCLGPQG